MVKMPRRNGYEFPATRLNQLREKILVVKHFKNFHMMTRVRRLDDFKAVTNGYPVVEVPDQTVRMGKFEVYQIKLKLQISMVIV